MRKSTLRSLLILGSAFALLAAFTPRANAALLRYYNFEGAATPPYPVNLFSNAPAQETGAGTNLTLRNTTGAPFPVGNTSSEAGLPLNVAPGDPAPNLHSLGIHRSGSTNLNVDIPFFSSTGTYDITSVSFAYSANGNGYSAVQVQMSTNGGATFTNISAVIPLPATPGAVIMIAIPSGTTFGNPMLVVRLSFTGGQSNGADLQNQLDNIQIGGTVVPEPATVAGGLLGVLGLCWHQRRRLRSVLPRFRRA
jgi:hypothetical protein